MKRPRFLDYYRQFEELPPTEVSRRLRTRRAAERSRELERTPPLDLSRSEWHEPPHPEQVNAATFALRRALNRYPDGAGSAARAAIARHHGIATEQVALGHGCAELLQAALHAEAAGGEAVLPWPSWPLLPALAARAGVQPVPVPLAGYQVDITALLAAVTPATRAVVLCTPNDPTGVVLPHAELRALCSELPEHVAVLVDEALVEFAGEEASAIGLLDELPHLLVFRSFSKAWALAGLRAGYVAGPEQAAKMLAGLGPGLGVAAPVQMAIASALEPDGRGLERLAARRRAAAAERRRLAGLLADTPFTLSGSSAHVAWLACEGVSAPRLTDALASRRIVVRPGADWGDDDHFRITLRDRAATERLASALRDVRDNLDG